MAKLFFKTFYEHIHKETDITHNVFRVPIKINLFGRTKVIFIKILKKHFRVKIYCFSFRKSSQLSTSSMFLLYFEILKSLQ